MKNIFLSRRNFSATARRGHGFHTRPFANSPTVRVAETVSARKVINLETGKVSHADTEMRIPASIGVAAAGAGLCFIGYCIYFDRKRRNDPNFKQKLRESK